MGKCSSQPAYVFMAHKLSFIAFLPTLVFTLIEFFSLGFVVAAVVLLSNRPRDTKIDDHNL